MSGVERALELLGIVPPEVWAVIAGLVLCWTATQRLKGWVQGRDSEQRDRRIRGLAFLLAFLCTYTLWPGWGWAPLWGAVITGMAAPLAYKWLVAWARQRWAWARKLSVDKGDPP